jgi:hypothetical protein
MAVTIANRGGSGARMVLGNVHARAVDITGPASYTTGGETLSAANIAAISGTGRLIGDIVNDLLGISPTGHLVVLDRTNSKIKYYNGTTEIGNGTNLSAVVARCIVFYTLVNG